MNSHEMLFVNDWDDEGYPIDRYHGLTADEDFNYEEWSDQHETILLLQEWF